MIEEINNLPSLQETVEKYNLSPYTVTSSLSVSCLKKLQEKSPNTRNNNKAFFLIIYTIFSLLIYKEHLCKPELDIFALIQVSKQPLGNFDN